MRSANRFCVLCLAASGVRSKTARVATTVLALGGLLAGCGPSRDQIRLARAMYSVRGELHPDYRDAIAILEKVRQDDRNQAEFVQYGMCETTVGVLGGAYSTADKVGKHTHLAVQKYQNADQETLAAMGRESLKFFKGEPHERALLAFYVGLACYMSGEYNDARIFFMQSLFASATRDEDMQAFRDDFQLGHFWLGRAFLTLGETDNARIAFGKARAQSFHKNEKREIMELTAARRKTGPEEIKGEAVCYRNASAGKNAVEGVTDLSQAIQRSEMPVALPGASETDPTELRPDDFDGFLDPEFQSQVNLVLVVELGVSPLKYLHGLSGSLDDFRRVPYKEKAVDVYLDGHRSGPAFRLLDTYHQAVTRGVKTRRNRQVGKVVAKEVLKRMPFVGSLAGYWDISADARYWPSLPGEIHVYAARATPGLHTVSLKAYDAADRYLPRFDVTRHFISVPEEGQQVLMLSTVENQDSAYALKYPTER